MDDGPSIASDPYGDIAGLEHNDAPKSASVRKRRRKAWSWRRYGPIAILVGLLIAGWVGYAVVWPSMEIRHKIATSKWKYGPNDLEISFSNRMIFRTCEYLYCFWFFYLGASIGSFINVVANRTPQGKTIVSRGSHCPYCDQPLSMLDNTPIFGWVALRGQCRKCRLPISKRYLTMEFCVGAIFMILAIVELMGNGMNLPHRDWKFGSGIVSTVFYPKWDLIGASMVHASLFAVAIMLIGSHMDRLRFPVLPLIAIGILYIVCATVNPIIAPVYWGEPWEPTYARLGAAPWQRLQTALVGWVAGTAVGVAYAWLMWRTGLRPRDPSTKGIWLNHSIAIFALSGSLLGWQAALNVGILSASIGVIVWNGSMLGIATGLAKDPNLRPQVLALAIVTITLFVHHLWWRSLAFLSLLPFRPGN
jgi:prepilin signal peptidase PulO-like enzyme (type II secretory pathway)